MQTTSNGHQRQVLALAAGAAALLVAGVGIGLLVRVAHGTAADAAAGVPVPAATALLGVLAAVGAAGLAWLLLGAVLEAVALAPGALGRAASAAAATVSPRLARRAVALVIGLGVGAGGVSAQAAPERGTVAVHHDASGTLPDPTWRAAPDPGWTPEPPRVRPQPDLAALGARPGTAETDEVVVRRGDSLWAIAARHLGEGATDAEIAALWPRWYDANRDVVGPDPDLIRPGQVLRPPTAAEAAS